jgi:hypothetical protein
VFISTIGVLQYQASMRVSTRPSKVEWSRSHPKRTVSKWTMIFRSSKSTKRTNYVDELRAFIIEGLESNML